MSGTEAEADGVDWEDDLDLEEEGFEGLSGLEGLEGVSGSESNSWSEMPRRSASFLSLEEERSCLERRSLFFLPEDILSEGILRIFGDFGTRPDGLKDEGKVSEVGAEKGKRRRKKGGRSCPVCLFLVLAALDRAGTE